MTAANDSEISAPCPSESAAAWGSFTGKKSGCQHHAPRECLAQAVRGDEAKPPRFAGADKFCRLVPPIQNEIGGCRHVRISGAERFGVTVAQISPHPRRTDKRPIADNEIRFRPACRARVGVA